MPERTVIVNPHFVGGSRRTLCIKSKFPNLPLYQINRETRQFFTQSLRIVQPIDSNGPTGLYLDGIKDTVVLLSIGFLRTRSLENFAQIAEPFSRVRNMSMPWHSTCWLPEHVAFMPSTFRSLETLTLLGYHKDPHALSQVKRWEGNFELLAPLPTFRHLAQMNERKAWIEEAFKKAGRSITIHLMVVVKNDPLERAANEPPTRRF